MLLTSIPHRFLFLDSLRGIAALYVVIFHFYSILKAKTTFVLPGLIDTVFLAGTVGVQIFFVLSGFVIAYSIYQQNITLSYLGRFFVRRSIRLDPPYWAAIILTLSVAFCSVWLFTKPIDTLPTWQELMANLFYLQDFLQIERIIQVSWTLCLEIQLYLFFAAITGFLFWIQKTCKFKMKDKVFDSPIFIISFGSLFLFSLFQQLNLAFLQHIPGLFTPYWYNFFIGSLLCWIHMRALSVRYYWMCCVLLILFLLITSNKQVGETLAISLIIYWVGVKGRLHNMLAFQPFQYLGKVSYSLYLTHWIFAGKLIDALARRYADKMDMALGIALLVVSLAGALITAHFFYQWIEYPSLCWSQKLKRKRQLSMESIN